MSEIVVIEQDGCCAAGTVGQIEGTFAALCESGKRYSYFRTFSAFPRTLRRIRTDRLRLATEGERARFEATLALNGGLFYDKRNTKKFKLTQSAARREKALRRCAGT
jgi:hypothetical protein